MQLAISAAKPRLSELIAAAQRGERVVITKRGKPAVELVACRKRKRRGGIDFERLEATCKRLGIESGSAGSGGKDDARRSKNQPRQPAARSRSAWMIENE